MILCRKVNDDKVNDDKVNDDFTLKHQDIFFGCSLKAALWPSNSKLIDVISKTGQFEIRFIGHILISNRDIGIGSQATAGLSHFHIQRPENQVSPMHHKNGRLSQMQSHAVRIHRGGVCMVHAGGRLIMTVIFTNQVSK